MDPYQFVRLIVESLALKLPARSIPAGPGIHPSSTPCYVTIALQDSPTSPTLTAPIPLASSSSPSGDLTIPFTSPSAPIIFSLDSTTLQCFSSKATGLILTIYAGRIGTSCGFSSGRLLGKVRVPVELEAAQSRAAVLQSGWVSVGRGGAGGARVHLVVRTDPDPRFVFQFGEMQRAATWAALRGRAAASPLPSILNHKSTSDHVLKLHPSLSIHRRSSQAPIPAVIIISRGYAHMMRRSPPVRSKEEEETESETETDDVEEEIEAPDISPDEGKNSEDWEGFVLNFGNKDKGGDEEDSP